MALPLGLITETVIMVALLTNLLPGMPLASATGGATDGLVEKAMPHHVLHDGAPLIDLGNHGFWKLFGEDGKIYFTSHMAILLLTGLIMIVLFPLMARALKRDPVPHGTTNLFEAILSFLRTEVIRPILGVHTDRFLPFLWTLFFFILFANVLGLVPIAEVIKLTYKVLGWQNPPYIGGAATGNVMVTGALALITFFFIHIAGIIQQIRIQMDPSQDPHHHGHDAHHGHGHAAGKALPVAAVAGFIMYWKNFVPAVPLALWPLMFVVELLGALIKPFALMMRLFANMFAGKLVIIVLTALVFIAYEGLGQWGAYGVSVPVVVANTALTLLKIFVCFLQAYIFMFLTTLFLGSAVAPEH